jgi:hypothetical protein
VHCFFPWQVVPQPPQLAGSLLVSTHAFEQRENPALQTMPHVPLAQVGPPLSTVGHTESQAPQ